MRGLGAILAVLIGCPAVVQAQDTLFFRSPSGNIHCMIFQGDGDWQGARCDIREVTTLSFARTPADCDLDWGHAFEVGRIGPGMPVCVGDTVAIPDAAILGYGGSLTGGGVTCTSEKTGMTCFNAQSHGFTIAKARQRVF